MHYLLRQFLLFALLVTVLVGAESRIPLLYEYQSPVPEPIASSGDILKLDDFIVFGKRYHLSPTIERDLERFLNRKEDFEIKKRRIEIVSEGELLPLSLRDEHRISIRGPVRSGLDSKLRDVFNIDLPGGGVLKAQFRSGLSIQIDKKTRLILRPSRNKLITIKVDW
jgi:hypothetical protein